MAEHTITLYRGQPFFSKILPGKSAGGAGGWFTPIKEKAEFYKKNAPLGRIVQVTNEPISNYRKAVHAAEIPSGYRNFQSRLMSPESIIKGDRIKGPLSDNVLKYKIDKPLDNPGKYLDDIFDDYQNKKISLDDLKALVPEGRYMPGGSGTGYVTTPLGKVSTAMMATYGPLLSGATKLGAKFLGPLSYLIADSANAPTMEDYNKQTSAYLPNTLTYPME
mgnify:CR=1 FL=1